MSIGLVIFPGTPSGTVGSLTHADQAEGHSGLALHRSLAGRTLQVWRNVADPERTANHARSLSGALEWPAGSTAVTVRQPAESEQQLPLAQRLLRGEAHKPRGLALPFRVCL